MTPFPYFGFSYKTISFVVKGRGLLAQYCLVCLPVAQQQLGTAI